MTPAELYNETVSFLATALLAEGDPLPMTAEDAAYTMSNWAAEDIEYPEGMTPDLMAVVWNCLLHNNKTEV